MRYHFHIVDNEASLNVEIAELDTYEEALDRGRALAKYLLQQEPYSENPNAWEIRVTDDDGEEILSIPLSEVRGVTHSGWNCGKDAAGPSLFSPQALPKSVLFQTHETREGRGVSPFPFHSVRAARA
jgi:hypothetical protein